MTTSDTMTFEQFIVAASAYKINNKDQRLGQAYFNTLHWHRPDIAEQVRGDYRYDPFYDDKRVNDFLGFVANAW